MPGGMSKRRRNGSGSAPSSRIRSVYPHRLVARMRLPSSITSCRKMIKGCRKVSIRGGGPPPCRVHDAVRGFTEALRQEMLVARHPVKVTCVHPGGIKTAVARNATVADGEDQQTFAEFFDRRLALHSPEMAAKTIVNGVAKGQARVVVGLEAKAVDVLARIMGSSYQRLVAAGVAKFFPWAK
ncbi:short-chain type dehydrogenase/reductase [Mycobacterium tuberculosis]|nr:short-chain type dehydrogenase/reductase [Mycobacterium tuberculosis]